jgi:hypothetical protein
MEKTYIEILAENDFLASKEYDHNPKDLLVEHNQYEENIPPEDHHEDELEDQEEYQKFGGSHQLASLRNFPKPDKTANKQNILYDKSVRTHVINIDSRFRKDVNDPSTDFTFQLLKKLKNVVSVRLSSIEFPNVYYTFSKTRGNISFTYYLIQNGNESKFVVTIPEGNYTPDEIATTLTSLMPGFVVTYNYATFNTGKMTFQNITTKFRMEFNSGNYLNFASRFFDKSIGSNLGFKNTRYSSNWNENIGNDLKGTNVSNTGTIVLPSRLISGWSITSDSIVDTIDNNYIFLTLDPDWKVVTNQTLDKNLHHSFAKIIVDVDKGNMLYDNGSNTLTKEFFFNQPSDIQTFPVKITDPYDQAINLNGMDFSFSLEFKELINQELYETMRM